jgi:hypothetical protein
MVEIYVESVCSRQLCVAHHAALFCVDPAATELTHAALTRLTWWVILPAGVRRELVECAKEQPRTPGGGSVDGRVPAPCVEQMRDFEACRCEGSLLRWAGRLCVCCTLAHSTLTASLSPTGSTVAMQSEHADAAFKNFVEMGRSWRSPTMGRHSMMHLPTPAAHTPPPAQTPAPVST